MSADTSSSSRVHENILEIDAPVRRSSGNDDTKSKEASCSNAKLNKRVGSPINSGNAVKKMKTKNLEPPKLEEPNRDIFCWKCHKFGSDVVKCTNCPRVYHLKCSQLEMKPSDWICFQCLEISNAETNIRHTLQNFDSSDFSKLLEFTLKRIWQHEGSTLKLRGSEEDEQKLGICKFDLVQPGRTLSNVHEVFRSYMKSFFDRYKCSHFQDPVDLEAYPDYLSYIVNPKCISDIEEKVTRDEYNSCELFLADIRWLVHNSYIYNGAQNELTIIARSLLKMAKQECNEIHNCPDCYLHANTLDDDKWFIETCRIPHILVWAKLRGFPFWPGKVVSSSSSTAEVRFFGDHNKAEVPVDACFLYSKQMPLKQKKVPALKSAIEEANRHIQKLEARFGEFCYSSPGTKFTSIDEAQQLKSPLPKLGSTDSSHGRPPHKKIKLMQKVDDFISSSSTNKEQDTYFTNRNNNDKNRTSSIDQEFAEKNVKKNRAHNISSMGAKNKRLNTAHKTSIKANVKNKLKSHKPFMNKEVIKKSRVVLQKLDLDPNITYIVRESSSKTISHSKGKNYIIEAKVNKLEEIEVEKSKATHTCSVYDVRNDESKMEQTILRSDSVLDINNLEAKSLNKNKEFVTSINNLKNIEKISQGSDLINNPLPGCSGISKEKLGLKCDRSHNKKELPNDFQKNSCNEQDLKSILKLNLNQSKADVADLLDFFQVKDVDNNKLALKLNPGNTNSPIFARSISHSEVITDTSSSLLHQNILGKTDVSGNKSSTSRTSDGQQETGGREDTFKMPATAKNCSRKVIILDGVQNKNSLSNTSSTSRNYTIIIRRKSEVVDEPRRQKIDTLKISDIIDRALNNFQAQGIKKDLLSVRNYSIFVKKRRISNFLNGLYANKKIPFELRTKLMFDIRNKIIEKCFSNSKSNSHLITEKRQEESNIQKKNINDRDQILKETSKKSENQAILKQDTSDVNKDISKLHSLNEGNLAENSLFRNGEENEINNQESLEQNFNGAIKIDIKNKNIVSNQKETQIDIERKAYREKILDHSTSDGVSQVNKDESTMVTLAGHCTHQSSGTMSRGSIKSSEDSKKADGLVLFNKVLSDNIVNDTHKKALNTIPNQRELFSSVKAVSMSGRSFLIFYDRSKDCNFLNFFHSNKAVDKVFKKIRDNLHFPLFVNSSLGYKTKFHHFLERRLQINNIQKKLTFKSKDHIDTYKNYENKTILKQGTSKDIKDTGILQLQDQTQDSLSRSYEKNNEDSVVVRTITTDNTDIQENSFAMQRGNQSDNAGRSNVEIITLDDNTNGNRDISTGIINKVELKKDVLDGGCPRELNNSDSSTNSSQPTRRNSTILMRTSRNIDEPSQYNDNFLLGITKLAHEVSSGNEKVLINIKSQRNLSEDTANKIEENTLSAKKVLSLDKSKVLIEKETCRNPANEAVFKYDSSEVTKEANKLSAEDKMIVTTESISKQGGKNKLDCMDNITKTLEIVTEIIPLNESTDNLSEVNLNCGTKDSLFIKDGKNEKNDEGSAEVTMNEELSNDEALIKEESVSLQRENQVESVERSDFKIVTLDESTSNVLSTGIANNESKMAAFDKNCFKEVIHFDRNPDKLSSFSASSTMTEGPIIVGASTFKDSSSDNITKTNSVHEGSENNKELLIDISMQRDSPNNKDHGNVCNTFAKKDPNTSDSVFQEKSHIEEFLNSLQINETIANEVEQKIIKNLYSQICEKRHNTPEDKYVSQNHEKVCREAYVLPTLVTDRVRAAQQDSSDIKKLEEFIKSKDLNDEIADIVRSRFLAIRAHVLDKEPISMHSEATLNYSSNETHELRGMEESIKTVEVASSSSQKVLKNITPSNNKTIELIRSFMLNNQQQKLTNVISLMRVLKGLGKDTILYRNIEKAINENKFLLNINSEICVLNLHPKGKTGNETLIIKLEKWIKPIAPEVLPLINLDSHEYHQLKTSKYSNDKMLTSIQNNPELYKNFQQTKYSLSAREVQLTSPPSPNEKSLLMAIKEKKVLEKVFDEDHIKNNNCKNIIITHGNDKKEVFFVKRSNKDGDGSMMIQTPESSSAEETTFMKGGQLALDESSINNLKEPVKEIADSSKIKELQKSKLQTEESQVEDMKLHIEEKNKARKNLKRSIQVESMITDNEIRCRGVEGKFNESEIKTICDSEKTDKKDCEKLFGINFIHKKSHSEIHEEPSANKEGFVGGSEENVFYNKGPEFSIRNEPSNVDKTFMVNRTESEIECNNDIDICEEELGNFNADSEVEPVINLCESSDEEKSIHEKEEESGKCLNFDTSSEEGEHTYRQNYFNENKLPEEENKKKSFVKHKLGQVHISEREKMQLKSLTAEIGMRQKDVTKQLAEGRDLVTRSKQEKCFSQMSSSKPGFISNQEKHKHFKQVVEDSSDNKDCGIKSEQIFPKESKKEELHNAIIVTQDSIEKVNKKQNEFTEYEDEDLYGGDITETDEEYSSEQEDESEYNFESENSQSRTPEIQKQLKAIEKNPDEPEVEEVVSISSEEYNEHFSEAGYCSELDYSGDKELHLENESSNLLLKEIHRREKIKHSFKILRTEDSKGESPTPEIEKQLKAIEKTPDEPEVEVLSISSEEYEPGSEEYEPEVEEVLSISSEEYDEHFSEAGYCSELEDYSGDKELHLENESSNLLLEEIHRRENIKHSFKILRTENSKGELINTHMYYGMESMGKEDDGCIYYDGFMKTTNTTSKGKRRQTQTPGKERTHNLGPLLGEEKKSEKNSVNNFETESLKSECFSVSASLSSDQKREAILVLEKLSSEIDFLNETEKKQSLTENFDKPQEGFIMTNGAMKQTVVDNRCVSKIVHDYTTQFTSDVEEDITSTDQNCEESQTSSPPHSHCHLDDSHKKKHNENELLDKTVTKPHILIKDFISRLKGRTLKETLSYKPGDVRTPVNSESEQYNKFIENIEAHFLKKTEHSTGKFDLDLEDQIKLEVIDYLSSLYLANNVTDSIEQTLSTYLKLSIEYASFIKDIEQHFHERYDEKQIGKCVKCVLEIIQQCQEQLKILKKTKLCANCQDSANLHCCFTASYCSPECKATDFDKHKEKCSDLSGQFENKKTLYRPDLLEFINDNEDMTVQEFMELIETARLRILLGDDDNEIKKLKEINEKKALAKEKEIIEISSDSDSNEKISNESHMSNCNKLPLEVILNTSSNQEEKRINITPRHYLKVRDVESINKLIDIANKKVSPNKDLESKTDNKCEIVFDSNDLCQQKKVTKTPSNHKLIFPKIKQMSINNNLEVIIPKKNWHKTPENVLNMKPGIKKLVDVKQPLLPQQPGRVGTVPTMISNPGTSRSSATGNLSPQDLKKIGAQHASSSRIHLFETNKTFVLGSPCKLKAVPKLVEKNISRPSSSKPTSVSFPKGALSASSKKLVILEKKDCGSGTYKVVDIKYLKQTKAPYEKLS